MCEAELRRAESGDDYSSGGGGGGGSGGGGGAVFDRSFAEIARVAQIPLFKLRGDSCFHRHEYKKALANYRAVCGLCEEEMVHGDLARTEIAHLQELLENTLVAAVHAKRARGLSKPLKQLSAPAKAENWVRTSAIIGVYQTWSGHMVLWEALRTERLRELGAQAMKLAAASEV